ncbi:hypothetical protein QJS66_16270 [Kocuria rhizophila]|nr:hypothetical protein QJS66_16270 [Kocuria rhizophila]
MTGHAPTALRELPALAAELASAGCSSRTSRPPGPAASRFLAPRGPCACRGPADRAARREDHGREPAGRSARRGVPPATIVTATDGNHGRAVARHGRPASLRARADIPGGVGGTAVRPSRRRAPRLVFGGPS